MPPTAPTRVRFHARPAELGVGAVVRVTNLTPQQLTALEHFIQTQLGGQRYNS